MTTNDRNAGDQSSIGDRKDGSNEPAQHPSRQHRDGGGIGGGVAAVNRAQAQQPQPASSGRPPNILVIWGDDIGTWNISHNSRGMMGYMTPNIDRIASEGVSFTDYYGQQSCTAGRAAFIGGIVPVRTGMTKVGLPGAKEGWQKRRDHRHGAQGQGLRHRPVRQEPPGRSRRASADDARLR